MKKVLIKTLVSIGAATMLIMPFAACNKKPSGDIKSVDAGSTWEVTEITGLDGLSIAEGAVIKAPEGYSLTMTVDGIETPIRPGEFEGNIVLTPTENIVIEFGSMGASMTYNYRAAIDVENGKYMAEKSVEAAVAGGTVTDSSTTDVKIKSVGENFNGIIVRGDEKSSYSIISPVIDFTGNGGNDFAGYGAAIMSSGNADVTLEKADISTRGAVRTAVFVGGNSTMHVNDSDIEVHNGTLPSDYEFSVMPGKMMEVPWMLGIVGNVRATNLAGNGTAYYNNTHVKAQGWGCLSTDDVTNTRLYAENCLIETVESGYGAFTLGNNISTFSKCTFNVADYGMISQDGDGIFTDGTVVNSGRFGVMYFGSDAYLTIDKGSQFNTKSTVIQIKGGSTDIVVDNAKLNPENGIILQMMANDDPYMSSMSGGGPGGGAPQGGPPGGGDMPGGAAGAPAGAPQGGGMPGGALGAQDGTSSPSKDVNATFSNMSLKGDIINAYTASGDLTVNFKNAIITGAITTSTIEHPLGPNGEEVTMEHPELYYLIGEVTNTYCATDEKFGVSVSLDADSSWVVDKTSYLTVLTIADSAAISAPEGYSVTMTVDGFKKAIKAGIYKGKIVLTVTK